jgi:hypothetical protein
VRDGLTSADGFIQALAEGPDPELAAQETQARKGTRESFPDVGSADFFPPQASPRRKRLMTAGALVFAGVLLTSFYGNVHGAIIDSRTTRSTTKLLAALQRLPKLRRVPIMFRHGRVVFVGSRVRTRPGGGIIKREYTGSVAVVAGPGHTGSVNGLLPGRQDVLIVQWDAQTWEEQTWETMWCPPGLCAKRMVRLDSFLSSINVEHLEVVP